MADQLINKLTDSHSMGFLVQHLSIALGYMNMAYFFAPQELIQLFTKP